MQLALEHGGEGSVDPDGPAFHERVAEHEHAVAAGRDLTGPVVETPVVVMNLTRGLGAMCKTRIRAAFDDDVVEYLEGIWRPEVRQPDKCFHHGEGHHDDREDCRQKKCEAAR